MPARPSRNVAVERAVHRALDGIDAFAAGDSLALPAPEFRQAVETLLQSQRPSVKLAALFLVFYWLEVPDWDLDSVPVGIRGTYGDKLLSEELTKRNITLHAAITAFAENLGWKGNVRNVHLSNDPRFSSFLQQIAGASPQERAQLAGLLAYRFAESKVEPKPMPPIGPDVLTFARAKVLFHQLIGLPSEGHVQQFLIAALLSELRSRQGIEVRTHHPHAADRFDETAGDVEEWRDGQLIRAYEVTVRSDWQNRISNFKQKMDHFGLSKYIIFASNINADSDWATPASMALALEPYGRDIAVVDILDVIHFLAAELGALELRAAVNQAYVYLSDPRLSGRDDFKQLYWNVVSAWLDATR